jgi:hypothetical protein
VTTPRVGWRELALVVLGFAALTVALTYPLAFHMGTLARVDNGDGQFSIWNVAWVARTLVVDPLHVFDANIFYPRRWTLAYSETNLGAGALAIPVYWATGNAYAAHNFVLLLSFVVSAVGTYSLVRYLSDDWGAALVAAIGFAFCPYVFSHTPHIQLLMTAGLPLSLLAFHRMADEPGSGRGAVLGLAMATQAFFCAYYAVFVILMVGFAVVVVATTRHLWTNIRYWKALAVGAGVSLTLVVPLFLPYVNLQRATGFSRSIDRAYAFSANWRSYLASGALAHAWMIRLIGRSRELLFPGFITLALGTAGIVVGWRARGRFREVSIVYGGLVVLAWWASLGPRAGLYRALYATIPAFTFMRAPERFGLVVVFALSVLGGIAVASLLAKSPKPWLMVVVLAGATAAELFVPLRFPRVPPVSETYRLLATLPWGPVIEMPVYSPPFAYARSQYMLSSTTHWMPLVDAYSDYIPDDFVADAQVLGGFPTRESFARLAVDRVRYAIFHLKAYDPGIRDELLTRLRQFSPYLVRHYGDEEIALYEIVGLPP